MCDSISVLQQLHDAAHITDCHVSGTHDPAHTTNRRYVCELQLEGLAKRVTALLYGVAWDAIDASWDAAHNAGYTHGYNSPEYDAAIRDYRALRCRETNKIPRRVIRTRWHYADGDAEARAALDLWESSGHTVPGEE